MVTVDPCHPRRLCFTWEPADAEDDGFTGAGAAGAAAAAAPEGQGQGGDGDEDADMDQQGSERRAGQGQEAGEGRRYGGAQAELDLDALRQTLTWMVLGDSVGPT